MTWSVLLCASCVGGVGIRPLAGRVREDACPVRDGRGWCGAVPVLDDGGLCRRGSGEGRGRGAGARGVEASRTCDVGHHYCGTGHPV